VGGLVGFLGGRLSISAEPAPGAGTAEPRRHAATPPAREEALAATPSPAPSDEPQLATSSASPEQTTLAGSPGRALLAPGALVMVPVQEDGRTEARLGWVVEVQERDQVRLLVGGHVIGPHPVPPGGFSRDGFGRGATVRRLRDAPAWLGRVERRRGPYAMVEFPDGERRWSTVTRLALVGAGAAADDRAVSLDVMLAPWRGDGSLYPAVVLQDPLDQDHVRVGYLDESIDWVLRERLRPLPVQGERVTYEDVVGDDVKAVVVGYPHRWLVEVVRTDDRSQACVALERVRLARSDRED
jgi:hypothetical protein